jgi:methylmalonyl-CoA mutase C-terminal domain/subunit
MVPKIMQGLREKNAEDVHVVVGGIILKQQAQDLLGMGVHRVFLPGTPPDEIIKYIQEQVN